MEQFLQNYDLDDNSSKKFLFFSAIPFGISYWYKPDVFFDSNGNIRPWSVVSPNDKEATPINIFVFCGILGFASFLFV